MIVPSLVAYSGMRMLSCELNPEPYNLLIREMDDNCSERNDGEIPTEQTGTSKEGSGTEGSQVERHNALMHDKFGWLALTSMAFQSLFRRSCAPKDW